MRSAIATARSGHSRRGHQQELVATDAPDDVVGGQQLLEPAGDVDEQLISGAVSEGVVDGLELVEIDEDDRSGNAGPESRARLDGRHDRDTVEQPVNASNVAWTRSSSRMRALSVVSLTHTIAPGAPSWSVSAVSVDDAAPQLEGVAKAGLHFELLFDSVVEHGRETRPRARRGRSERS